MTASEIAMALRQLADKIESDESDELDKMFAYYEAREKIKESISNVK